MQMGGSFLLGFRGLVSPLVFLNQVQDDGGDNDPSFRWDDDLETLGQPSK